MARRAAAASSGPPLVLAGGVLPATGGALGRCQAQVPGVWAPLRLVWLNQYRRRGGCGRAVASGRLALLLLPGCSRPKVNSLVIRHVNIKRTATGRRSPRAAISRAGPFQAPQQPER